MVSGYLIDTNVLSLLSPVQSRVPAGFMEWLDARDRDGALYLSVVAVHEIEKGVALLEHKGARAKALALRGWLTGLIASYGDRIIVADMAIAALAGQMEAKAIAAGHNPGMADATIAATAQACDLVLVTCNTRHFVPFGIRVASPEDVTAS